ncbi:MAG: hypothetical protein ACI88H_003849 [Cocleimonas sp.]|jgi:hypothetical protein
MYIQLLLTIRVKGNKCKGFFKKELKIARCENLVIGYYIIKFMAGINYQNVQITEI